MFLCMSADVPRRAYFSKKWILLAINLLRYRAYVPQVAPFDEMGPTEKEERQRFPCAGKFLALCCVGTARRRSRRL